MVVTGAFWLVDGELLTVSYTADAKDLVSVNKRTEVQTMADEKAKKENVSMDIYEQLIDNVKKQMAERARQGKEFNVFKVQGTLTDEVKICRLLRELLDPNGSHGQGYVFLELFLKQIGINNIPAQVIEQAKVYKEYSIQKDNRRIDILLNIDAQWIPFEVKIFAGDLKEQCFDYYDYVKNKKNGNSNNTILYYLTLDGHEPSQESLNGLRLDQYQCISFEKDITAWLDACIGAKQLEQIYPVREILIQFRNQIKELVAMEESNMSSSIKELFKSEENRNAAKEIAKAWEVYIQEGTVNNVFAKIREYMKEYAVEEIDKVSNTKYPHLSYKCVRVDSQYKDKIELRFEIDKSAQGSGNMYFGIFVSKKNDDFDDLKNYINSNLKPEKDLRSTSQWIWWKYLNKDDTNFRDDYEKLYNEDELKTVMEGEREIINQSLDGIPLLKKVPQNTSSMPENETMMVSDEVIIDGEN